MALERLETQNRKNWSLSQLVKKAISQRVSFSVSQSASFSASEIRSLNWPAVNQSMGWSRGVSHQSVCQEISRAVSVSQFCQSARQSSSQWIVPPQASGNFGVCLVRYESYWYDIVVKICVAQVLIELAPKSTAKSHVHAGQQWLVGAHNQMAAKNNRKSKNKRAFDFLRDAFDKLEKALLFCRFLGMSNMSSQLWRYISSVLKSWLLCSCMAHGWAALCVGSTWITKLWTGAKSNIFLLPGCTKLKAAPDMSENIITWRSFFAWHACIKLPIVLGFPKQGSPIKQRERIQ